MNQTAPGPAASAMRTIAPEPRVLEELVHRSLRDSGYTSLRNVACQCAPGTARLTGQMPSFFMKQTAQEIVRRIDGIGQIHNHLEVVSSPELVL